MEKLGELAVQSLDAISTWQSRLKKRQEELSGKPDESCLLERPAVKWPQYLREQKYVIAAMCLAERKCEACYEMLRNA